MKNLEFQLNVQATSYVIYPGKEAMTPLSALIARLEIEDEFQDEIRILGYFLDEMHDKLYVHRGVNLEYLKNLLQHVRVEFVPPCNSRSMNFEYEEIIPPRNNEQLDVINFIAGLNEHASNVDDHQLFLVKAPGFG